MSTRTEIRELHRRLDALRVRVDALKRQRAGTAEAITPAALVLISRTRRGRIVELPDNGR